ncbi:MAG: acetamidase/formamidase family protein [Dongiaceae bacterium]
MQLFPAEDLKNVYSPYHAPFGRVEPGETFQIETQDGFAGALRRPEDLTPERLAWAEESWCIATGPIEVRGATPADVVAVTIEAIEVTTPGLVIISRYRAPSPDDWWLESEFDRLHSYPVESGELVFNDRLRLPARPLIGCIATAPKHEVVLSRREAEWGGNQDCNLMTTGATILLPVNVPGGLLYFGDCKVMMGDGELVNAPECGTRITATARLRPRPRAMSWPRVETPELYAAVVSNISAADAVRHAFRELLLWLEEETGGNRQEIAMLMGMVAHAGICQVSNTFHTASCRIERRYLDALRPPAQG